MTAYESLGLFLWHDMRAKNSCHMRVGALTSILDADRVIGRLWFDSFVRTFRGHGIANLRIHPLNPIVQAGDPNLYNYQNRRKKSWTQDFELYKSHSSRCGGNSSSQSSSVDISPPTPPPSLPPVRHARLCSPRCVPRGFEFC